jgi:hypothetical protein
VFHVLIGLDDLLLLGVGLGEFLRNCQLHNWVFLSRHREDALETDRLATGG